MGNVAWRRSMCESGFYAVFIEVTLVQYVVHLSDIPTCDIGGDIPTESSCLSLSSISISLYGHTFWADQAIGPDICIW